MASKHDIRRSVRTEREARHPSDIERMSVAASEHAHHLVRELKPRTVTSFLAHRGELDLTRLHSRLVADGVTVAVPRTVGERMVWVAFSPNADLERGRGGVPQPASGAPVVPITPGTLVLAPAAAIDRAGNRVGWGGGYYDRFLAGARARNVFAVVYDSEVLDAVPVEPHDQPVSGAVTPSGIIRIGSRDPADD